MQEQCFENFLTGKFVFNRWTVYLGYCVFPKNKLQTFTESFCQLNFLQSQIKNIFTKYPFKFMV